MSQNIQEIYWSIDCPDNPLKPFHFMSSRQWMLKRRSGLPTELDERSHRELEQQNKIKEVLLN